MRAWWAATAKLDDLGRDYLRFLLLTGLRRRETSGLRWDNIDFRRRTLTLAEGDTKAGRELALPLTDHMLEILHRREGESRPFAISETKRMVALVSELSGVVASCHDLRRSFAGYADELGISLPVLKSLLNHSAKVTDVTLGYIGSVNEARKREALQQIEAFVLGHAGEL